MSRNPSPPNAASAFSHRRCVITLALGNPVVPEVKMYNAASLACTADADAGLVAGALTANRSRSSTVSVSLSPAPPQSVTALTRSVSAIRTLASSNPRLCASTSPRWW